jgi:hypothetical protein
MFNIAYIGDEIVPFKKLISIALLILMAGCQNMNDNGVAPYNPGGSVTLIFNRTSTVWFAIVRNAQVYVDDLKVCVIPDGGNCIANIAPGKHILKVDSSVSGSFGAYTHSYQFESGKTYRFLISPNKTEMVANAMPLGVASLAYYESNKGETSSDNGDFTMTPAPD